jgi:TonB family protein
VTLALIVGTDGRAHDIKVLKPLGHGLDEKAVEAVQSWKWEPALDEGRPIESKMNVDVSFRFSPQPATASPSRARTVVDREPCAPSPSTPLCRTSCVR